VQVPPLGMVAACVPRVPDYCIRQSRCQAPPPHSTALPTRDAQESSSARPVVMVECQSGAAAVAREASEQDNGGRWFLVSAPTRDATRRGVPEERDAQSWNVASCSCSLSESEQGTATSPTVLPSASRPPIRENASRVRRCPNMGGASPIRSPPHLPGYQSNSTMGEAYPGVLRVPVCRTSGGHSGRWTSPQRLVVWIWRKYTS
jgi:hypothetical protein